uniref:Predicted protein n=1 Tax=Hordeum vulgare subsp. vulgare TaxID=112509 RepID=F2DVD9_HORVV|nr:predicted protein [Hordeum vulgare subsp. vulgare]
MEQGPNGSGLTYQDDNSEEVPQNLSNNIMNYRMKARMMRTMMIL